MTLRAEEAVGCVSVEIKIEIEVIRNIDAIQFVALDISFE